MKRCPYCAEEIQDAAILCRFCNRDLASPDLRPPVAPAAPVAPVMVQAIPTNGKAIAALVLGILWLWWVGSVLALILGYSARTEIKDSKTPQAGEGLATAGIVLGWIGVGIFAFSSFGVCAAMAGAR